ncbi:hypothetical protein Tco_1165880 [Tanacetum coccineum]
MVVPQSSVPSDPTNLADEDSMTLKELMDFCTKLQQRVLDLENTKTTQAQEITSLKKLEKKGGSRTHKLKRLYKVGRSARIVSSDEASLGDLEDASKQGRKIDDSDKDTKITLVDETQGRHDDIMFNVSDLAVSTASTIPVSAATITKDEITLAQALSELKSVKPKVTTATTSTTNGILLQEPSESITTTTTIPLKDKGKAKFDEEVRLTREKDEANVALIEEWNDIQAKIGADYQLAQRLQAQEQEELTIKERAKLFQQLLEKRRKHCDTKRVEEKRNIPPIKAQQRNIMCTYLKNMVGWKPKYLKNKRFDSIQKLFDKAMKMVNTFVDMDTELVKEKIAKMKEHIEVVHDEEEIAIDAIPLATKPSSIRYSAFIHMLRSFDREDLETLWKLVKAKHGYTRPEEDYERVLWGDLKIMFEPHVEDLVWRNLQGNKVLIWKLFNSYGVHFVRFQNLHVFMLVEKKYPLTPATIIEMLNKKLQADHWNEMCYQLLKLNTKQLKNQ